MALRELGWVAGRNLVFEDRRSPAVEELHSLAAELVNLKVDVIFTGGTPAIRAAKRATTSIPIVMLVGIDPVWTVWSRASHGRAGTSQE